MFYFDFIKISVSYVIFYGFKLYDLVMMYVLYICVCMSVVFI